MHDGLTGGGRRCLATLAVDHLHASIAQQLGQNGRHTGRRHIGIAVLDGAIGSRGILEGEDLDGQRPGLLAAQLRLLLQCQRGLLDQFKVTGRAGDIDQPVIRIGAPAKAGLPDPGSLQRLLEFCCASLLQIDETGLHFAVLEDVEHITVVVPDQVVEGGELLQKGERLVMLKLTVDLIVDLVADHHGDLVVGTEVDQHVAQTLPFCHIAVRHGHPVQLLCHGGTLPRHHGEADPQQGTQQGLHTHGCHIICLHWGAKAASVNWGSNRSSREMCWLRRSASSASSSHSSASRASSCKLPSSSSTRA